MEKRGQKKGNSVATTFWSLCDPVRHNFSRVVSTWERGWLINLFVPFETGVLKVLRSLDL